MLHQQLFNVFVLFFLSLSVEKGGLLFSPQGVAVTAKPKLQGRKLILSSRGNTELWRYNTSNHQATIFTQNPRPTATTEEAKTTEEGPPCLCGGFYDNLKVTLSNMQLQW